MAKTYAFTPSRSRGKLQRGPRRHRKALTLIEMLVSVTLTLLVVFAIVQVFEFLGDSVSLGRATIEMAGQLRNVANRLQSDLDNRTCPVRPWIDPGSGLGYFEYVEGPKADTPDATLGWRVVVGDKGPVIRANLNASFGVDPSDTTVGDFDDVLAMTVKSSSEPFRGQLTYYQTSGGAIAEYPYKSNGEVLPGLTRFVVSIESSVAEVIWWVQFDPVTQSRVLRRRALLVLPNLNNVATYNPNAGFLSGASTPPPGTSMSADYLRAFHNENDVSIRVVTNMMGEQIGLAANSLGDLTTPRNRFAHYRINPTWTQLDPDLFDVPSLFDDWYYPLDLRFLRQSLIFNAMAPVASPTDLPTYNLALGATVQGGNVLQNRFGEDIILSDLQGFDVKAFDPTADIQLLAGISISPSDPGYVAGGGGTVIGEGAFVDLAYDSSIPSAMSSVFSAACNKSPTASELIGPLQQTGTGSPVDYQYSMYDTWTMHYERDGVNQDHEEEHSVIVDSGTNGIDDAMDNQGPTNGVDDIGERESAPPYDIPLRGIEVRIRMIEVSTQQVRQVSVIGDFTDF